MDYEKLVREWCAHYGGSVAHYGDRVAGHRVTLPDGMEGEDGETDVWAGTWMALYIYLTTSIYYPATRVGPVPGGAR